jgi:hypothetical protein
MIEERSSKLAQALEHFREIRNVTRKVRFESPMDVAYSELLEAVAEELIRQQSVQPAIRRSADTLELPVDTVPRNKLLRSLPSNRRPA